jgi:hypothetical protein
MPRGASPKREREYKELVHKLKQNDRYEGREEQVAARIVNKQRAQYGETKGEKVKDREGKSADRNLPIDNYQHMTIEEVKKHLDGCSQKQLQKIQRYEAVHKDRKGVKQAIDQQLHGK